VIRRATAFLFDERRVSPVVYSLNVPLPSSVTRLATDLSREWPTARARRRNDHTLVCKRLGDGPLGRVGSRVREALAGTPAFEARTDGIDCFETAATGPSPVLYLTVESSPLTALHDRFCEVFDPVEGIEGADYVPHVTVARGGDPETARRLVDREIDPIRWTVESVHVYDADRGEVARRFSLPA
jgi:2'-5' RNA ligase